LILGSEKKEIKLVVVDLALIEQMLLSQIS
jgi:hypothetical protein